MSPLGVCRSGWPGKPQLCMIGYKYRYEVKTFASVNNTSRRTSNDECMEAMLVLLWYNVSKSDGKLQEI